MRISDWSSDVCSSDLSGVRKMRAWPRLSPLARPASPGASTPPAILARLFLRPAAMQGPTFQQLIQTLNAYWAAQGCVLVQPLDLAVGAGDRKSVVSGKGGSVRLDSGGGGLIKKNK